MHLSDGQWSAAVPNVVLRTRDWYDSEADSYAARTTGYDRFPGLLGEISRFTEGLGHPTGPVLDLGCGAGRDAEFLGNAGHTVVAGDISAAMLAATAARCDPAKVRSVRLDMRRLPFAAGCFAGAWVCASMVHLPAAGMPGVLDELLRTLRPGGRVAISMKRPEGGARDGWSTSPNTRGRRWFSYVAPDSFAELLRERGFADTDTVSSNRGSWFIAHGVRR